MHFKMRITILIILFTQTVWGQTYSAYLTDKEVDDFLMWEMRDPANNQSEFFEVKNKRLKTLRKANDWKVKYIVFHKDSLEYVDFFKETFRDVDLRGFLSDTEIAFLKNQFEVVRTNIQFNKRINPDNFVSRVKDSELTVTYSIPLASSDKTIYLLLKDYTWDKRGECVINIYKKLDNGQWSISKAQPVSVY